MRDLTNPTWIKVKGLLFLFLGLLAAALIFLNDPTLKIGLLLFVTVWSFCRFYYFAFYVLQRYVDRDYRFSGLLSFARYFIRIRREGTVIGERPGSSGQISSQSRGGRYK
jgi:hypothetical protein